MKENTDKFNKFYEIAISCKSYALPINRIRNYFENLAQDDLISILKTIQKKYDHEILQLYFYYLLLFRNLKNLQRFINSKDFPIDVLEKLVFYTYGYYTLYNYSIERIFDELFNFISQERLLELTLKSNIISNDKLLLFHILAKLDTRLLDRYFSEIKSIPGFIEYFLRLPDYIIRSLITRNYKLYKYIMILISDHDSSENLTDEFYKKYQTDILQLSRLSNVIRYYNKSFKYTNEKEIPFLKRNMDRISYLVFEIGKTDDPVKAIEYFASENIFVDIEEKEIISSIVSNPMFKNTFELQNTKYVSV